MNETLLKSQLWTTLKSYVNEAELLAKEDKFNIFSVSTSSYALENFHSDIWGMLLDPKGPHKMGNLFLDLFFDFLKTHYKLRIPTFTNSAIHREKHRMDILIKDANNQCIIIENKINDAVDQDKQIDRYINKALKEDYKIDGFIYITLSGQRHASSDLGITVTGIAASDNSNNSLLKGWIEPCIKSIITRREDKVNDADAHKFERVYSFLLQYSYLLNFLTPLNNLKMSMQLLYEMVNDKEDFKTALLIEEKLEAIKLHRLAIFNKNMPGFNYLPFKKQGTYDRNTPNYLIYSGWEYFNARFKLGIVIYKDRTEFVIYDEKNQFDISDTVKLLEKIEPEGYKFKQKELNNHFEFKINLNDDGINSLEDLDALTVSVTKELFKKINEVHSIQTT